MAPRVRLRLTAPGDRQVDTVAVLNGGFEVPDPHLLLPAACAERLVDDYRAHASRQRMEAAGATPEFWLLDIVVEGAVVAGDRTGPEVCFRVLVSDTDSEALVSDGGIDALGVRIESFLPGRWRFADESTLRDTEAPQCW